MARVSQLLFMTSMYMAVKFHTGIYNFKCNQTKRGLTDKN